MRRHSRLLRWGCLGALVLLDLVLAWQWHAGAQSARQAGAQLAACERLAQGIEALRSAPLQVEETERSSDSLAQLIEAAAREIGLGTDRIVHVSPDTPRRIGDSPYVEQTTGIELREVTLAQLIDLTFALSQQAPGIQIPSLVMRVPPRLRTEQENPTAQELWNAQLTLTSRSYVPTIAAAPR